ncbi:ankyrin repeat-containing protein ITN1-like [Vigna radiata var. radiata]|uniref:Ankyrin repeat-containing protein ITN1-like n=1 Tax=Vigna radiata var. radiata TaxID=3916 RepID=A0A1S3UAA0_VIGRR|nr:ankyrin repeat-containing protein ITN1-like [Vigna radiata var. radiata]
MLPIVEKDPNSVRIQLNRLGDRALHVAAGAGSTAFVQELVKLMSPGDVLIHNEDQMLPVHLAALSFHHRIVQLLCSDHLLDKMAYKDIEKLFFITITNNMFDVAITLFEKRPLDLTFARDEHQLTSLHMLARKSYEVLGREIQGDIQTGGSIETGMELLYRIVDEVKKLQIKDMLALTTQPSAVLFDALESRNGDSVIRCFMGGSSLLITFKDFKGRNLMHLFFLYRRLEFFEQFQNERKQYLLREVDNEGNNVLHLAALLAPEFKSFSGLSAKFQMEKELSWFKDAERIVPDELRSMRNKKDKTPIDVFYDEHNQLSKGIKESAVGITNSGMIVATLVATVAFAAALTVPGEKNNASFIVFIFANAIALFTSSASILSFLTNFISSRFANTKFVISLHPSLHYGLQLLMFSVEAMACAFIAASFLIFDHKTKWVPYVVIPMAFIPFLVFIFCQSKFLDSYWSKYYRPDPKLGHET